MDFLINYGVDLALVAILIINIVECYHRGFVKAVLSLIAAIIAITVAVQLSAPVAEWSYDTFAASVVEEKVAEAMPDGLDGETVAQVVQQAVDAMPDYLVEQLEQLDIDIGKVTESVEGKDFSKTTTAHEISEQLIKPGALILLKMLCYIAIFFIVMAVLRCIIGIICKFTKLPVLKTANQWLGAGLGLVKGVVIVVVLCYVCGLAAQITSPGNFKTAFENSRISEKVAEINIGDLL